MKTEVINRIKEIQKGLSPKEKAVFKNYFVKGKTLAEISKLKEFGISKQGVSMISQNVLEAFKDDPVIREFLDKIFEKKDGEEIYIDPRLVSPDYYRLFVSIAKSDIYNLNVVGKHLVTSDKSIEQISLDKNLNAYVKEHGLPVQIGKIRNGRMSKVSFFFYMCEEGHWILSKDKSQVIGNRRLSFMNNVCKYQTKQPKSLWDIYEKFCLTDREYLQKDDIATPEDLSLYIRRRIGNIRKMDDLCQVERIALAKETELGYPLYEIRNVKTFQSIVEDKIRKIMQLCS